MPAASEQCQVRQSKDGAQCTGPVGHEGSHGIYVGGGLIIAPWSGGYDPSATTERFEAPCNSCGGNMNVSRSNDGGATLSCTACDQMHFFGPDGSHTCNKITLFSSNPSPRVQLNQLDERFVEFEWCQRVVRALGYISADEYSARVARARRDIDVSRRDYAMQLRPWWRKAIDALCGASAQRETR